MRICPSGDYTEHYYNSCKHRSCPRCGGWETARWTQRQEKIALPTAYYHIIFTVPQELNTLWRYNRKGFVGIFFKAARQTLRTLFMDPHWVGGEPGVLGVFQSWGETLNVHPHLHMLVTAGGLNKQGQWAGARQSFLFPVHVLRTLFQGKLLFLLREAVLRNKTLLPPAGQSVWFWRDEFHRLAAKKWNVHIQPPYHHPRGVIRYLAFYMHGGPISESRIALNDRQEITVSHKQSGDSPPGSLTLQMEEFLARFLAHVPPKGLRMVRSFGLFHHRAKKRLAMARCQLTGQPADDGHMEPEAATAAATAPGLRCPRCGALLIVRRLTFRARAPPERLVA